MAKESSLQIILKVLDYGLESMADSSIKKIIYISEFIPLTKVSELLVMFGNKSKS